MNEEEVDIEVCVCVCIKLVREGEGRRGRFQRSMRVRDALLEGNGEVMRKARGKNEDIGAGTPRI